MEARYTGQADVELSASGAYQAKLLGARLTKETLDAIVSSDLRRTRATAQAIAHYHGLPVWEDADLREFALGAWEEVASLPVARGHVHDLPIFKNHLYSIGGAVDFSLGSTGAIQVGTFE